METISRRRRFAYALGNPGFQITDRIVVVIAIYFYLPPPGRGLVAQVPDMVFLGVLTAFGIAMQIGRVIDSAADPIVGFLSDRSRSRFGRRRIFLMLGIVPMVVIPALLFWPPREPGSVLNALWLAGLLAVYFVFFTIYVAPYLALIPELAWDQRERVGLSRLLAITGFPALVAFSFLWPLGLDLGRELGLDPANALRWIVVAFSLLAFVLCLAPIVAVDEGRFARGTPSDLPLGRALKLTLANRPFLIYLAAQLPFLFGLTLVQPAMPYISTVLLGRSEGFAAVLGLAMLGGVAIGFVAMDRLVARYGPRRVMMMCVLVFCAPLALLGLLQAEVPGGPHDRLNLAIALSAIGVVGFPVVGFMIVPHVLLGQLIDEDERRTGANRSAMFFGVQGFLTKWVYGASLWAMTLLLSRFGNSPEEPLGIILIGPVAAGACLVSLFFFARYPEERVLAGAVQKEERPGR